MRIRIQAHSGKGSKKSKASKRKGRQRRQKIGDLPPHEYAIVRRDLMTSAAKRDARIERSIERRANERRRLAALHSPYLDYVPEDLDDVA